MKTDLVFIGRNGEKKLFKLYIKNTVYLDLLDFLATTTTKIGYGNKLMGIP